MKIAATAEQHWQSGTSRNNTAAAATPATPATPAATLSTAVAAAAVPHEWQHASTPSSAVPNKTVAACSVYLCDACILD